MKYFLIGRKLFIEFIAKNMIEKSFTFDIKKYVLYLCEKFEYIS